MLVGQGKFNKAQAYVILTILFHKEEEQWVAICKELGTAVQADTIDEARVIILDAVETHLNSLEESGERERFFDENKIKVFSETPNDVNIKMQISPDIFTQSYSLPLQHA